MFRRKKVQCLHFIFDIKPYLHNTFIFLNVTALCRKPFHHKIATCDPDSIFKILNQMKIFLIS